MLRDYDLSSPFLSLIIPAHNEEKRLPGTLQKVADYLTKQNYSAEVVVVENGSSDQTLQIARSFEKQMPFMRVLHEDQGGKGRAVKRGMLDSCGEYRLFCDVDFSMPIDQINRFFPPLLANTEIAIASREAPGAVRYNEPQLRHLAGRIFNTLVRWTALPGLQDTQCGFKCFHSSAAEKIFRRQTMMGWSFDVEVLFIAQRWGYKIVEIPIPWYFDGQSRVHMFQDSLKMVKDILGIRQNAWRGRYDRSD